MNKTDKMPSVLRLKEVMAFTGLSRSSIYAFMNAGRFPASMRLGERSVGWLAADIEAWIEQCAQNRPARDTSR